MHDNGLKYQNQALDKNKHRAWIEIKYRNAKKRTKTERKTRCRQTETHKIRTALRLDFDKVLRVNLSVALFLYLRFD